MNYLTVPLSPAHRRQEFCCGNTILDNYLHHQAGQDVKRKLAVCFILADDENLVQGYYTLSKASVARHDVPQNIIKRLPPVYQHLPATLLGRLAVDKRWQGSGLGEMLLLDALKRSYTVAVNHVASLAVIVDPIDEAAGRFYSKYGFVHLPDSGKMFLPVNTIATLFR